MPRLPVKETIKDANFIQKINFEGRGVEVNSERVKGDHERCDSICRCSKLIDVEIRSIDLDEITDCVLHKLCCTDPIDKYCIGRIISRIKETDFDVEVKKSYYGEEIEGVFLIDIELANVIAKIYDEKDTDEKIRLALSYEYGYLLPALKNCKFAVNKVPIKYIEVGNEDHYKKLDVDAISRYKKAVENKDKDYIFGVCRCFNKGMNEERFKLVDGYHRFYALNEMNVKVAKYITFE